MKHLISAVRLHAMMNYEEGWDVVVEAWTDEDIAEVIGKARTVKSAIARVGKQVAIFNSYADDIRATAF